MRLCDVFVKESVFVDITFLISHLPDPRYKKRFEVLKDRYEISVIYWNKRGEKQRFSDISIEENEVALKANQTSPLKRIPQWLQYGKRAISILKQQNPKCIYVGNFDMLAIAEVYQHKYARDVKIIYEIADLHRYLVDDSHKFHRQLLKKILVGIESRLLKKVDLLVLTSWKFFEVYYSRWIQQENVVLLPNMPRHQDFATYQKQKHDRFTVGYVGTIRYKNQLKMLIRSAKKADVNVYFAGASSDDEIERICQENCSYCTFGGAYNYSKDIVSIYQKCDAIYSVYDADLPNVRVALPNKLYEAIICEIPLIVAKNTYLSELVKEWGVGASVSHEDEDELTNALLRLKDDSSYYRSLCQNCNLRKNEFDLDQYNQVFSNSVGRILKQTV